jgi:NDP-sugar pyrophosphorylase family protein
MNELTKKFMHTLLTENEELRKFPKEFVKASLDWIRPWLFRDDPVVEAVLDSKGNHELKIKVLEAKIAELQKDKQFLKELGNRTAAYERMKNFILKSKVEVKGDASIGDKSKVIEEKNKGTKNAIIDSNVQVGGNLKIGDEYQINSAIMHSGSGDIIQGDKTITNHYYGGKGMDSEKDKSGVKKAVQLLVAQGDLETAIAHLVDYTEANKPKMHNDFLLLSGQFHAIRNKVNRGLLSHSKSTLERNKIQAALMDLLSNL